MRLGEGSFISKLDALDTNICETTHVEGNFAKTEISSIIEHMENIYASFNYICFLLYNENNTIIGICCINIPLFNAEVDKSIDNDINIDYLCGSNYKYSGTILLNIVKQLFYIGDFKQIKLTSYTKSIGFYLKNGFAQTMSMFNTPTMTITK